MDRDLKPLEGSYIVMTYFDVMDNGNKCLATCYKFKNKRLAKEFYNYCYDKPFIAAENASYEPFGFVPIPNDIYRPRFDNLGDVIDDLAECLKYCHIYAKLMPTLVDESEYKYKCNVFLGGIEEVWKIVTEKLQKENRNLRDENAKLKQQLDKLKKSPIHRFRPLFI